MDKSMLLEVIGDTIENRFLDFLIEGRGLDYSKKDIAEGCGISRPTVYAILPKMLKEGLVKSTRKIGRVQLYTLNEKSEKVKIMLKLEEMLLKKSFEEVGAGKMKIPA
ncbi:MAG: winged helix-turn-helix transcriptional regulator [Candidatus Aenigmarchaeota archaeon]|nr:winged helix-turn-helix transcriptional regulator [Candidatus Aenigmarchaeota archaeon]